MKARLNTLMGQAQQELNSFGDAAIYGDKNQVGNSLYFKSNKLTTLQQGSLILRLMTQFARDFVSSIEGTNLDISTKELSGGARIYYIFNDVFGNALLSLNATQNLDNQDIRTAIRNSTGPRPSLFVPEVAFDLLVKPQIKLLEAPSLRCVELVYEELVKICHNCTSIVSVFNLCCRIFISSKPTTISGASTIPSASCSTDRGGFGPLTRTAGSDIRIRTEPYFHSSSVH